MVATIYDFKIPIRPHQAPLDQCKTPVNDNITAFNRFPFEVFSSFLYRTSMVYSLFGLPGKYFFIKKVWCLVFKVWYPQSGINLSIYFSSCKLLKTSFHCLLLYLYSCIYTPISHVKHFPPKRMLMLHVLYIFVRFKRGKCFQQEHNCESHETKRKFASLGFIYLCGCKWIRVLLQDVFLVYFWVTQPLASHRSHYCTRNLCPTSLSILIPQARYIPCLEALLDYSIPQTSI